MVRRMSQGENVGQLQSFDAAFASISWSTSAMMLRVKPQSRRGCSSGSSSARNAVLNMWLMVPAKELGVLFSGM